MLISRNIYVFLGFFDSLSLQRLLNINNIDTNVGIGNKSITVIGSSVFSSSQVAPVSSKNRHVRANAAPSLLSHLALCTLPLLLPCFVAVLSCDSAAPTAAVKETHMFYLWLLRSPIMAMERKPGYILLQLVKILLCPTSKYMFLSKKYRYRYHDTCSVFPDIGLIPNFAVLPAPRLSSSPNVLHMKKIYFLVFWGEAWLCQDFTEGLHEHAQVLFFPLTIASLFLQSKTDCCFFSFFFFTFLQQLCFSRELHSSSWTAFILNQ